MEKHVLFSLPSNLFRAPVDTFRYVFDAPAGATLEENHTGLSPCGACLAFER